MLTKLPAGRIQSHAKAHRAAVLSLSVANQPDNEPLPKFSRTNWIDKGATKLLEQLAVGNEH